MFSTELRRTVYKKTVTIVAWMSSHSQIRARHGGIPVPGRIHSSSSIRISVPATGVRVWAAAFSTGTHAALPQDLKSAAVMKARKPICPYREAFEFAFK